MNPVDSEGMSRGDPEDATTKRPRAASGAPGAATIRTGPAMLNVWLVALREAVEALLLLVATAAYLPRSNRPELLLRLSAGALVGAAAGTLVAFWTSRSFGPLAHALFTLAFGIFLAWMAAGTLTSKGRIGRWIRDRVDLWAERLGWPIAVFVVAAAVIFREAFELGFYFCQFLFQFVDFSCFHFVNSFLLVI